MLPEVESVPPPDGQLELASAGEKVWLRLNGPLPITVPPPGRLSLCWSMLLPHSENVELVPCKL
jgi:hypothetical protein